MGKTQILGDIHHSRREKLSARTRGHEKKKAIILFAALEFLVAILRGNCSIIFVGISKVIWSRTLHRGLPNKRGSRLFEYSHRLISPCFVVIFFLDLLNELDGNGRAFSFCTREPRERGGRTKSIMKVP